MLGALLFHGVSLVSALGWWWAEAFDHAMVHVAVLCALGAALAGLRREWAMSGLLLVLFTVDLVRWWPRPPAGADGGRAVTVLFANVLGHNPGRRAFLALVEREDPDIIGLAEVTPGWARALEPLRSAYPFHLEEPREDAFGVALYSRVPLDDLAVVHLAGAPFPSVQARVTGGVQVLVTHPPPPVSAMLGAVRREQLAALDGWMAAADGRFVAMGDLNCAPWTASFPRTPAQGALRLGTLPSLGALPPWWGVPIDHVLVGSGVGFDGVRLGSAIGSDHRPVVARIRLP